MSRRSRQCFLLKVVIVSGNNFLRVIYGLSTFGFFYVKDPIRILQILVLYCRLSRRLIMIFPLVSEVSMFMFSLRLFRALFILSIIIREESWTPSLESFEVANPQLIVEFDANLFGGGVIIDAVDVVGQREVKLVNCLSKYANLIRLQQRGALRQIHYCSCDLVDGDLLKDFEDGLKLVDPRNPLDSDHEFVKVSKRHDRTSGPVNLMEE